MAKSNRASIKNAAPLTGVERKFKPHEIIVSKTDINGTITYANDVFYRISGYSKKELMGAPHNLIRHPHMPRCVFKLLWEHIQSGREIFAYVVNRSKNGDHYWVFAHVTPSYGLDGELVGYHSNRRAPRPEAVKTAEALYHTLIDIEKEQGANGLQASYQHLNQILTTKEVSYDQFILSI